MYDSPEGYINDETFVAWVYRTDEKHIAFWEDYTRLHPEHIQEAKAFLLAMELKEAPIGDMQAALNRLRANMETQIVPMPTRRWYYAAAAAAVILMAGIGFLKMQSAQTIRYATGNGETKAVTLADGSKVMLNANSSLEVKKSSDREVWLKGEAFFTVTTNEKADRFLVHADEMNIEVLGTEFNVKQRRSNTTVVLQSGKVKLSSDKTTPLIMRPGELVTLGKNTHRFSQKAVNTDTYTAWKQGQMVFENASIREIADILEEHFGLKVILGGETIRQTAFNGTFPADNKQMLLDALSRAYSLDIEQHGNTITIREKE